MEANFVNLAALAGYLSSNERHAIGMVVRDVLLSHLHDPFITEEERTALMRAPSHRHYRHIAGELGLDALTRPQQACAQIAWRDTFENLHPASCEDL